MAFAHPALRPGLETQLAEALTKLPAADVKRLDETLSAACLEREFTYDREEGGRTAINFLPMPVWLSTQDRAELCKLGRTLRSILVQVLPYARKHPPIAQLLPLEPEEEAFLGRVHSKGHDEDPPLLFRLDVDIDFARPDWHESATFYEYNGSSVGGFYYSKASEMLLCEQVAATLEVPVPPRIEDGMPDLMLAVMRHQADRLGRRGLNIAYIEDRSWTTGITEGPSLAEYFNRAGARAIVVDPRELRLKDNDIWAGDLPIDIVYRNMEMRDLVAIEKAEGHLRALEQAFARNQVVSSIWGDFDHKSLWEVLDTPEIGRQLTAAERHFLKKHIPWTRTLRHAFTRTPEGDRADLLEYVRTHRERLVIKPNRGCGGTGVTLGPAVTAAVWERTIETAQAEPGQWVVQGFVKNARRPFPMPAADGRLVLEDLYTAYGFLTTPTGFGCLGRASRSGVVNVSQGGGIFPVLSAA